MRLWTMAWIGLTGCSGIIRHIGGVTRPPHHPAIWVHQQAEFAPNNPTVVGHAFATNLLRAAAFADGVNTLNPIRVSVGFTPTYRGTRLEGLLLAYFFPRDGLPSSGAEARQVVARVGAKETSPCERRMGGADNSAASWCFFSS